MNYRREEKLTIMSLNKLHQENQYLSIKNTDLINASLINLFYGLPALALPLFCLHLKLSPSENNFNSLPLNRRRKGKNSFSKYMHFLMSCFKDQCLKWQYCNEI